MKLKHIESCLSSLCREFPHPNITLEQYPTSANLTACVVATALEYGDLGEGRTALDLGCGTGMLLMGCAVVGCDFVIGVDCDADALIVARKNSLQSELDHVVDLLLAKVTTSCRPDTSVTFKNPKKQSQGRGRARGRGRDRSRPLPQQPQKQFILQSALDLDSDSDSAHPLKNDGIPLQDNCVDTVVTNPPFGTKHNAGMDICFLQTATRLARRAVYSFHKTSTRAFLIQTIESWGYQVQVIAEMKFDIPNTYAFHQKKSIDVDVDLIRIYVQKEEDESDRVDKCL